MATAFEGPQYVDEELRAKEGFLLLAPLPANTENASYHIRIYLWDY
jgi:hypothetical protein